jgi:hypothetical protein
MCARRYCTWLGDDTDDTLTSTGSFTPLCVRTTSSNPCHAVAN